jgi:DNA-binding NarL/FixJ family response regulator
MNHSPLVILFADKNPQFGRRLRGELRERGARILLAGSSDEAIHQAALAPPDIVVMDDDLKSDGQVDLGTFLREAFPHAGIIVLRGDSAPTSSAGGLDLLLWGRKPVRDQTILETIEYAFPGRLGTPTPSWPIPGRILCVDDKLSRRTGNRALRINEGIPVSPRRVPRISRDS